MNDNSHFHGKPNQNQAVEKSGSLFQINYDLKLVVSPSTKRIAIRLVSTTRLL